MPASAFDIVVPTVGRPSLPRLLQALAEGDGPRPERIVLVDDRNHRSDPLVATGASSGSADLVRVLPGPARGPATARNLGWRACSAPWVAFLDDDVEPTGAWLERLAADLAGAARDVAGVQGRIRVPLEADHPDRAPTDWERNVAGLAHARWATADMAYRRDVLEEVGGFDERFPRAYREDVELGLRVIAAGYRILLGQRVAEHPVPPADAWVSVRKQAGNADDALMRALHGGGWRRRAGAPPGRRPVHVATTAAGAGALLAAVTRRPRAASIAAAAWLGLTAEFAWRRIRPGPRDRHEVATMLATSAVLPAVATYHWLRGLVRARRLATAGVWRPGAPSTSQRRAEAVLVDRDGTLVEDVPYNGDPSRVRPLPGVADALGRLRDAGLAVAVVTNQSGIARGLLTTTQVDAVNARVEELLGPFDGWFVCPHGPEDGCDCRKPAPGLITKAAADLGVDPTACAVVGDIGSDVDAALAAGARGILVPRPSTRPEEVLVSPEVAADLAVVTDRVVTEGR